MKTVSSHLKKIKRMVGLMDYWINEKKVAGSINPLIQPSNIPANVMIPKLIILIAALMVILNPLIATACPGCNFAMDNTVGRGFNMSILFMMAMPFFVVGSMVVGLLIYRRSQYNHTINLHETSNANQTEEKEP